ncbi:Transport protein particle subunit trs31 [Malassezia restricta CBS 7877]|uniref:Trafficking protein particle complex subunit n=1 Tax=Malassezia restricta (strain ATCC 96810 / NBRC 103918 / CBS 7877) TaxID=425264 RepID=A0A3G2S1W3_MALR7|nr:Transport protein particle subunit trs31 [Malassezia restricta CBS 7877]
MPSAWSATYALPPTAPSMSRVSSDGMRMSAASGSVPDILERPRDKTRHAEVSLSALQFLFAEMVVYAQDRVSGIAEFEQLLGAIGRHVGLRALAMQSQRAQSASNPKRPQRETRLLKTLLWIHTTLWKVLFGSPADNLERSTESDRFDEYMITTNTPLFSRGMSVPKEMEQLSVEAYTAGIVEGALEGLGFPARVTAHTVSTDAYPDRTTILIKLDRSVMERETAMGGP